MAVLTGKRHGVGFGGGIQWKRGGRGGPHDGERDGVVGRLGAAASGDRSGGGGGEEEGDGARALEGSRGLGEMGKKREGWRWCLNRGGGARTWPVEAGIAGRRGEVEEEREAGFAFRIPAVSGAGAGEREGEWVRETWRMRGRGRHGLEEAGTWARRRLRALNSQGAGTGFILTSLTGDQFKHAIHLNFRATNNTAEYKALLVEIKAAAALGSKQLIMKGDSELVVNQVHKDYKCSNPELAKYLVEVRKL
uniref:Retrotransposon protein, putative, unclassified n=1 Tax=Oryza sativa subsp. japonica TaxID=39947 RepID=Q2QWQ2_ORYSJ|nr:retrotransposon protein, putative, unclassified [Oryza sativa Japonica Group]